MPTLPLKRTVPLLIVMPLLLAVGATGLLAYFNGRRTASNLARTLIHKVAFHVEDILEEVLTDAQTVNRLNAATLPREGLSAAVARDFEQQAWSQVGTFSSLAYVYLGTERGEFIGAAQSAAGLPTLGIAGPETGGQFQTYSTTAQGDRQDLVAVTSDYDPRRRPWYEAAIATGEPTWGPIYVWSAPYPNLVLPAVQPTRAGVQAVMAADISLVFLSELLSRLEIGRTGQVFILERDGRLVATSTTERPYNQNLERVAARESSHPLTQATTQAVLRRYGNLATITEEGQFSFRWRGRSQVVQVYPFREESGLDWLVVVVVPVADFMDTVTMQAQITLLLGGAALAIAAGLGLAAARYALQPLMRLNEAAAALKAQQFESQAIEDLTHRTDEVGEFARVFRGMAATIGARAQSLDEQLQALRSQVKADRLREQDVTLARLRPLQKQLKVVREAKQLAFDLDQLLSTSSLIGSLPVREREKLAEGGQQRICAPGEIICREGEPARELFLVLVGTVEIFVEATNQHLATLRGGDVFGELSLLMHTERTPRTTTAIARNYTTIFQIDRPSLTRLLEAEPQLRETIRALCRQSRALKP